MVLWRVDSQALHDQFHATEDHRRTHLAAFVLGTDFNRAERAKWMVNQQRRCDLPGRAVAVPGGMEDPVQPDGLCEAMEQRPRGSGVIGAKIGQRPRSSCERITDSACDAGGVRAIGLRCEIDPTGWCIESWSAISARTQIKFVRCSEVEWRHA
jgi:hypothetical protein